MANVYINKKKIVIVSINDNQTAKDIAAQLKQTALKMWWCCPLQRATPDITT